MKLPKVVCIMIHRESSIVHINHDIWLKSTDLSWRTDQSQWVIKIWSSNQSQASLEINSVAAIGGDMCLYVNSEWSLKIPSGIPLAFKGHFRPFHCHTHSTLHSMKLCQTWITDKTSSINIKTIYHHWSSQVIIILISSQRHSIWLIIFLITLSPISWIASSISERMILHHLSYLNFIINSVIIGSKPIDL
jgi:hypothetical protein